MNSETVKENFYNILGHLKLGRPITDIGEYIEYLANIEINNFKSPTQVIMSPRYFSDMNKQFVPKVLVISKISSFICLAGEFTIKVDPNEKSIRLV